MAETQLTRDHGTFLMTLRRPPPADPFTYLGIAFRSTMAGYGRARHVDLSLIVGAIASSGPGLRRRNRCRHRRAGHHASARSVLAKYADRSAAALRDHVRGLVRRDSAPPFPASTRRRSFSHPPHAVSVPLRLVGATSDRPSVCATPAPASRASPL